MVKKKKEMIFAVIAIIALALVTSTPFASSEKPNPTKFITISSYPIGSLGTILATAFSNAIEKKTGIRTRPTPADTDVGRILPMKTGEAQVGIITAATVHFASEGKGEFSAKDWGPQRLDLKGKKVAFPPGLFALTVPAFLAYGGLAEDDVVVMRAPGYIGGIKMVMQNKADACHAVPVTGLMKEWEAAPYKLRYLPMDQKDKAAWERMRNIAPFMASPIWADYGALGEGGAKWLAYYPYTLTAYENASEDVIYTIVKALVDGRDLYKDVKKPSSGQWTLKDTLDMGKPVYVPFHAGLIKYAKEQGKWTAELEAWQTNALKAEEERVKGWKAKQ
jgi:hypothetical protein